MSATSKLAAFLAIDITTSALAIAVRGDDGTEAFAQMDMEGDTIWYGDKRYPGFDLDPMPDMIGRLLDQLVAEGWSFDRTGQSTPGYASTACRQHDMVVLGQDGEPLLPAISWQCNAATKEVEHLRKKGVESVVGRIEPRFVLPKLQHVLAAQSTLKKKIDVVFMTGDWLAWKLTGVLSLAKSDALSNGLLDQASRKRADGVLRHAGFKPRWFPKAISTGKVVGTIAPTGAAASPWETLRKRLGGWKFVAGLGDNHASALGCGLQGDGATLVVSAGTSGTVNLACAKSVELPDDAAALRFEFFDKHLMLLLMLGDCGAWYMRFVKQFAPDAADNLARLNPLANDSDLSQVRRVLHDDGRHVESFPADWQALPLGRQVADTQFSIALELLLRVARMRRETQAAGLRAPDAYLLTGGLSQSPFFQHVFHAGIRIIAPEARATVSGRSGPLRFKTSAYGALVNAELPLVKKLDAIHAVPSRFPQNDCESASPERAAQLDYLLRSYGLS